MENKANRVDYLEHFYDNGFHIPTRTIYIGDVYGVVEDGLASDVIKAVHIMENESDHPICVYLNSCGGYMDSGLAIYEKLKNSHCHIHIDVYGACMSAASIIPC